MAGVNERTIWRAIGAGQLPARKHRGAFRISPADLVAWQADYEAGTPPDKAPDSGPAAGRTGPAPSATTVTVEGATVAELWRALEDEGGATIAAKDETIDRLDTVVAFLREQLDQRSRELGAERERFDVIQQIALTRIEALTTGGDQQQDVPEHPEEPPRIDARGLRGGISSHPRSRLGHGGRCAVGDDLLEPKPPVGITRGLPRHHDKLHVGRRHALATLLNQRGLNERGGG